MLGLQKLTLKSIIAIIDFRKSIIGFGAIRVNPSNPSRAFLDPKSPILDFESQLLQSEQSEQSESLRGQKPTSSNPSHPSNPSRPQICALTFFVVISRSRITELIPAPIFTVIFLPCFIQNRSLKRTLPGATITKLVSAAFLL